VPLAVPGPALADLTLLLVLFFVLTTTYDTDRSAVSVPVSASASAVAELGSACVVVDRQVDPNGRESVRWRFSDGFDMSREIAPDALFFAASRVADHAPETTFVVKADAFVRWAVVDGVIETLRDAGVRNVVLWTGGGTAREDER
jgi:biopolymer transport protein ExbD